jgi:hypothetical protein
MPVLEPSGVTALGGFTPAALTGLALWLRPEGLTGLNDTDPVAVWPDSSGNSRDATQATANKRPLYRTGIRNNWPVVRFDGSNDGLVTPSFSVGPTYTLFIAGQVTGGSYPQSFAAGDSGAPRLFQLNAQSSAGLDFAVFNNAGGFFEDTQSTPPTAFHIAAAVRRSTEAQVYGSGASNGATATTGTGNSGARPLTIGIYGDQTSQALTGDIAEVILYDSGLSNADRALVEAYLAGRFAVTLS